MLTCWWYQNIKNNAIIKCHLLTYNIILNGVYIHFVYIYLYKVHLYIDVH